MKAGREERVNYRLMRYGEQCCCGRKKWPGFSFCRECMQLLPEDYRRALFGPLSPDYELAYDSCVAYLASNGVEIKTMLKVPA